MRHPRVIPGFPALASQLSKISGVLYCGPCEDALQTIIEAGKQDTSPPLTTELGTMNDQRLAGIEAANPFVTQTSPRNRMCGSSIPHRRPEAERTVRSIILSAA